MDNNNDRINTKSTIVTVVTYTNAEKYKSFILKENRVFIVEIIWLQVKVMWDQV